MAMIFVGVAVAALLGQIKGDNGIVNGMFDMIEIGVVNIVIPLSAFMMLWLGVMRLAERSGMVDVMARVVRPIMTRLFPDVPDNHPAMSAMIMNMAANVLGLGNAATPLGLKAMQELDSLNPNKGTATNAMCTFLAINTSSVTLIPGTAIGLLAAQGMAEPYAIVSTTIGATLFSTMVAIVSVKLFERMAIFNRAATPVVIEEEGEDGEEEIGKSRKIGKFGIVALSLVAVIFAGIVYLETFPNQREQLQEALGLREIAIALDAEKNSLEEVESDDSNSPFRRLVSAISVVAIPFIIVFFILFAALKKVPVYEEFVEGAKEGWGVAVRIMPFIVAMLAALAILRNSGALYIFTNALRPVLDLVGFPAELVPMALMRPLSGSGSQGVLVEILTNEGLSEMVKYAAATMYGSTETTFYVLAVYFGSVGIRRTRHALAAGLCADLAGVIAAVIICRAMFG